MPGTFLGAGHPAIKQPPAFCGASQGWGVVEERVVSKPSPKTDLLNRDGGSRLEEMVIEITE